MGVIDDITTSISTITGGQVNLGLEDPFSTESTDIGKQVGEFVGRNLSFDIGRGPGATIRSAGLDLVEGLENTTSADIFGDDLFGEKAATEAALSAAQIQGESAQAGIEEQRRQFDLTSELLGPFTQGGTQAFGSQQDLLGVNGPEAQRAAIAQLENSPMFQSLTQQGENALLQNAAATGGVRGGNVQRSLAQFRPQMLNQAIQNQFSNLSSLSQMGQASAARTGAAGQQTGVNIAQLLEQQGAAQAGGVLAQGSQGQRNFQNALGVGSVLTGIL